MPEPAPQMSAVDLASLSALLRWVAWQTEGRGPQGKPTKVPYGPDGRKARADAPSTWGTRAAAEARAAKLPRPFGTGGVGLELGDHDGLAIGGIDLDSCRDPNTGALTPWATDVLELFRSYAEVSPSGTGVKVFFLFDGADLPALRATMGTEHGKQFKRKGGGDHPPAIELYVGNRYFAVTGQILDGYPTELRKVETETLDRLVTTIGPEFASAVPEGEEPRRPPGKIRQALGPTKAGDGSRSAAAFKIAAEVRRGGGDFPDFLGALEASPETAAWKVEKGQAEGGRELRRAWERAGQAVDQDVLLTEHGVALAFTKRHQNGLRYCHDAGSWYEWTGTHWGQDRKHAAYSFARQLVAEANRQTDFKTQAITGKAAFAGGVEKFAQRDPALAVTAEAWDRDPYLLATPGGTVDLRTGIVHSASPADMMTRVTAVAPAEVGTDCPTWRAFLQQATQGDIALIGFLKRWCGYCLTGDTKEHALLFGYGPGGNGKSVFQNTLQRILGDYAAVAAMDTFTASHGDKHPTDLAMLRGARLVCASETEEGRAWAESRIKQMTGGDPVSARFMRQDFFTYIPQFKLTIVGNHKPVLRNVDEAARRRFNIVPFLHKPTNPDRDLERKLEVEWPAILRWMIDGCLAWQVDGLPKPAVVAEATAEYFEAQDHFGRWLAECCIRDQALNTKPAALLGSFQQWCQANGEEDADNRRLRGMIERTPGLRYVTTKGIQWVRGIGLRPPNASPRGGGVEGGGGSNP
jgi:putative DNA primase/helicase